MNRQCTTTGLSLVQQPVSAYRVARESYGPFSPPLREANDDRDGLLSWGRFDTPGRTLYAAEDRETAFLEALSWARQDVANFLKPLPKSASHLGITVGQLRKKVEADWGKNGSIAPDWVPAVWRDGRRIYQLTYQPGWWVDITHSDTLKALSTALEKELDLLGIPLGLTLSEVTSSNRPLTTLIATWLREEVTLDDGSQPMGIRFQSKHGRVGTGQGSCWAFWARQLDAGLQNELVSTDKGEAFKRDDPDYTKALKFHNISSR